MAKSELGILKIDPYLTPYKADLELRMKLYKDKRKEPQYYGVFYGSFYTV